MMAENMDGFCNPTMTPEQEAKHNAEVQAKREYEAAHTPVESHPADDDEDDDEDSETE